jgi:hypothetical protein
MVRTAKSPSRLSDPAGSRKVGVGVAEIVLFMTDPSALLPDERLRKTGSSL